MSENSDQNPAGVKLEISVLTILKITAIILLLSLVWKFVNNLASIFLLFIIALALAVALAPLVDIIKKTFRIKNQTLAVSISFASLLLIVGGLLIFVIPTTVAHVTEYADNLPKIIEDFENQDNFIAKFAVEHDLNTQFSNLSVDWINQLNIDTNDVLGVFRNVLNIVVGIVVVIVMTFLMLLEGSVIAKRIKQTINSETYKRWSSLGTKMKLIVSNYFVGQLIVATLAGLFATAFLLLLKVSNAVALGTIVALFALIPLIGAFIGATIVILLTLLVDAQSALILILYFVIYQQVENITIQPYIQGQQTNLTTLQVLIAALLGATLSGVVGAILAIPAAGCLKLIMVDYLEKRLKDKQNEHTLTEAKI